MPGFLGGSSGSSGTGGEITFPKEFIDPVTKLRVSQPENLIDTDFEYGLQPTKWETVELINNTPSFFSKSGDTTIPNIVSIATNNGTREITVITATDHGLAVGIPINVTGTKSVTADGSYVINSIPNTSTFTYLCKDEQTGNNSIEDLYSSIITGEFFQGSQIRIADAEGVTTDAEAISTLTVKTDSTHGFGLNTPFYFLNLNSTISQEFEASNTAAKSFDSSNSATAQTFDGSNTLSTFNIDWSNSATVGGTTSTISSVNTTNDTITVAHGAETFASQPLGTPLYYNLTVAASSGYFATNPRGVVFLKTTDALNSPALSSTFQVSATPDGDAIDIVSSMSGTFQLANQARTFAGNNVNSSTQKTITVIKEAQFVFDGGNQGFDSGYAGETAPVGTCTIIGYTGSSIAVTATGGGALNYYVGAMVKYTTSGSAATGLSNNATYFVSSITYSGTPGLFNITIKGLPTDASALSPSGGTGTQGFTKIGVSLDKDIVHVRSSNFTAGDLLKYSFPEGAGGRFAASAESQYYFVEIAYDDSNYKLTDGTFSSITATGGTISDVTMNGKTYRVHTFTSTGSSTFSVSGTGSDGLVDVLVVAGGGGGAYNNAGGGGAGGLVYVQSYDITSLGSSIAVTVGTGGAGRAAGDSQRGGNGANSTFGPLTAIGGGGSSLWDTDLDGVAGGSGGGGGGGSNRGKLGGAATQSSQAGVSGSSGFGFAGGQGAHAPSGDSGGGGGGGSAQAGTSAVYGGSWGQGGKGGDGRLISISGNFVYYAAGGGAGGGGGGLGSIGGRGGGGRGGSNTSPYINATAAVANTGSGGGGGDNSDGGAGGSGIVIVRYPTSTYSPTPREATGGTISTYTVSGVTYKVHTFSTVGSTNFVVSNQGNLGPVEYLICAGGGGGGRYGGGGGGGGVLIGSVTGAAGTYAMVVGGQGLGRVGDAQAGERGSNGGNSSAFGLTALGGGAAGSYGNPAGSAGADGGSGGGGGGRNSGGALFGGMGTQNQGYSGGTTDGSYGSYNSGGGGGAAGNAIRDTGQGGPGIASSISGTSVFYGSGGSGSQVSGFRVSATAGGGTGRTEGSISAADIDGVNGTGGGGGGGRDNNVSGTTRAGNGGTGVIILRYPISLTTEVY
jgi:hypothetical protein